MLRSDFLSSSSKEKLDLERRFLEILPIYKNVKDNVFGDLWRLMEKRELSNSDRTYYDRHFYKRPRPKRNQIVHFWLLFFRKWTLLSFRSKRSSPLGKKRSTRSSLSRSLSTTPFTSSTLRLGTVVSTKWLILQKRSKILSSTKISKKAQTR